jgi:DNA-binding NtrC family response regulator
MACAIARLLLVEQYTRSQGRLNICHIDMDGGVMSRRTIAKAAILVYDDHPDVQTLATELLPILDEGYQPRLAINLAEAANFLQTEQIEAIIADCPHRPFASPDFDLLRQLQDQAPGVPVILCSEYDGVESLDPSKHGLFAIVPKPFDEGQLIAVLRAALSNGREPPFLH